MTLKVISLFAGPGAGKSTVAAMLFALMKMRGFNVELVTEVAKDWTYEKNPRLRDQFSVLAEQNWRLQRLAGEVEWVVTDSPLPLGLAYCNPEDMDTLEVLVDNAWAKYDNFPIRLERQEKHPYRQEGRSQTLDEAKQLDSFITNLANDYYADDFPAFRADSLTVEYEILEHILDADAQ